MRMLVNQHHFKLVVWKQVNLGAVKCILNGYVLRNLTDIALTSWLSNHCCAWRSFLKIYDAYVPVFIPYVYNHVF